MFERKNTEIPKDISVSRYTWDVWRKMFPEVPKNVFEEQMGQENTLEFALAYAAAVSKKEYPNVRVVAFDDEFIEWIKKNGKSFDDVQAGVEYMNSLSNLDVERLFVKNNWHHNYILCGIPVYILDPMNPCGKKEYKLPENARQELLFYLEKIYGRNNVFLTNYVMKIDDFYNYPGPFLNIAKAYFEDGQKIRLQNWKEQRFSRNDITVFQMIIPYVVRWKYDSAVFNLTEILYGNQYLTSIDFNKKGFRRYNVQGVEDFLDSEVERKLVEYFESDSDTATAGVMPYSLLREQILEEMKHCEKLLKKMRARTKRWARKYNLYELQDEN